MKDITFVTKHIEVVSEEKFTFKYNEVLYRASMVAMSTIIYAKENFPNDSVIVHCKKI